MDENFINKLLITSINHMKSGSFEWPNSWDDARKKKFLHQCLTYAEQNERKAQQSTAAQRAPSSSAGRAAVSLFEEAKVTIQTTRIQGKKLVKISKNLLLVTFDSRSDP